MLLAKRNGNFLALRCFRWRPRTIRLMALKTQRFDLRSRFYAADSVFFGLTTKDKLTGVVLLIQINLNLLPHRLNLPPLPLSAADQIAKEETLEDWNQRHREDEKNTGQSPRISERRITLLLTSHFSAFTSPLPSHLSRPRQRPSGAPPRSLPYTASMRRSWAAFDNGGLQSCVRLEEDTRQRI